MIHDLISSLIDTVLEYKFLSLYQIKEYVFLKLKNNYPLESINVTNPGEVHLYFIANNIMFVSIMKMYLSFDFNLNSCDQKSNKHSYHLIYKSENL